MKSELYIPHLKVTIQPDDYIRYRFRFKERREGTIRGIAWCGDSCPDCTTRCFLIMDDARCGPCMSEELADLIILKRGTTSGINKVVIV